MQSLSYPFFSIPILFQSLITYMPNAWFPNRFSLLSVFPLSMIHPSYPHWIYLPKIVLVLFSLWYFLYNKLQGFFRTCRVMGKWFRLAFKALCSVAPIYNSHTCLCSYNQTSVPGRLTHPLLTHSHKHTIKLNPCEPHRTLLCLAPRMSSLPSLATYMKPQCLRPSLHSAFLGCFPITMVIIVEHTLNTSTGPQYN